MSYMQIFVRKELPLQDTSQKVLGLNPSPFKGLILLWSTFTINLLWNLLITRVSVSDLKYFFTRSKLIEPVLPQAARLGIH